MVEFMHADSPYRPYREGEDISIEKQPDIEEPIIPISELGTTAIDVAQGGGNILQNLDKSIRMGTKKIQLIISGGGNGNPSALASTHGTDVRREVREKAKSTGVEITGVELSPGRVSGLAGYNPQNGSVNEEHRQDSLRQVKYAVKFAADVGGGGGVDIWSQEFQRNIFDAPWNKGKSHADKMFFDNGQDELKDINKAQLVKYLIDARSGDVVRDSVVRTNHLVHMVEYEQARDRKDMRDRIGKRDQHGRVIQADDYVDVEGNVVDRYDPNQITRLVPKFDPETKMFKVRSLKWDEVEQEASAYSKKTGREITPEEWAYQIKLLTNIANVRGHASYYYGTVDRDYDQLKELVNEKQMMQKIEQKMTPEERKEWVEQRLRDMQKYHHTQVSKREEEQLRALTPSEFINEQMKRDKIRITGWQELVTTYRQQEKELLELWQNVKTPYKYAAEKTFDSYADAGRYAWQVTREQHLKKPVYVGPEIGWAGQSYGGHPDEFIEIVKKSRERMKEKLVKEEGVNESAAEEAAKKHIKGMLDTSHLTMWYKHFARKPGDTDEQHLKRFNEWAEQEVRKMVKAGVVGGVQIVDSITGEHSHLPAGQGIFKITNLIRAMKEEGFDGPMVSEGHEEEGITQGRILTETWRAFGSPIRSATPGQPGGMNTWRGIHYGYFGMQMPHTYIVGSYAPSNDWQLWSESPFE